MNSQEPELFLSERHSISGRTATIEDYGRCAFLYLSEPNSLRPVGDCWLYNRIPAPKPSEVKNFRPNPPPAAQGYAGENALMPLPDAADIEFRWATDGDTVAVLHQGTPLGLLVAGEKGMSLHLLKSGPWGEPWDQQKYNGTMENQAGQSGD